MEHSLEVQAHKKENHGTHGEKIYKPTYSLLGDIGGTNMRFELVLVQPPHNEPLEIVKKGKLLVKDHSNFEEAIKQFLSDVPKEKQPEIAVVGVAGPVEDNVVVLSNVPKWGSLSGDQLEKNLGLHHFVFLNDFIANSYGLLLFDEDNFISLNGLKINPKHIRGVLGPGTGLGNSVIYSAPFRKRERIYVLPSEAGHSDTPYINDEVTEYLKFLGEKIGHKYVGLEYSFCGPAIPYMYQFLALKNPNLEGSDKKPTSEEIISSYLSNREEETLFKKTVDFFISLYSAAICNFILYHMPTGGVYLVGGLTVALVERLKESDLISEYLERHPEMTHIVKKVPLVVSKEVDLGLKGAYVYARRIVADEQHE